MDQQEYINNTKERYKDTKLAKSYKSAYTRRLDSKNFKAKIIGGCEQRIVKEFIAFLKRRNALGETVLDVPAGTGKMTATLLGSGLKVTSGDISKEMMAEIDPELKDHENYMEERVADAAELPFEDNSFDLVVSIRLLHRVDAETRRSAVKEAKRVSRGYCIISFAKDSAWHNLRFKAQGGNSSPGMEKMSVIKKELEDADFKIIKKKSVLPIFSNEVVFLLKT